MNLLGIDVGTSGCKVALFSVEGVQLASAYLEYDSESSMPGRAQLNAQAVWDGIRGAIRSVSAQAPDAKIMALSVSSLGEAVVPVSAERQILGPSILNFDERGEEFVAVLAQKLPDGRLYAINGNTLGNHYSLTKLKWIKMQQPELYERTHKFLHWAAFVAYMLGAETAVDYSLANRTLLFDLAHGDWSEELLQESDIDREKLPRAVPAGTVIGSVSAAVAADLALPEGVLIVCGAHDQVATAVGCGVTGPGSAVYGMGAFHCITPVFVTQPAPPEMIARGLNTEHHAVPDRFVSFIYNQGGMLVKWYRDTYAAAEYREAAQMGRSIYAALFAEMPPGPGSVMVLPHFTTTGPPDFIADSAGLICGLKLETTRGEILRGIIEGSAYYLKENVDALPGTGININDFHTAGGGSKSDAWVQTNADIFGKPMIRTTVAEAGALGAAIIAGVGSGHFSSYEGAVAAMVTPQRTFEPDLLRHEQYQLRYNRFRQIWPAFADILRDTAA